MQELFHLFSFEILLRATEIAGNNGKRAQFRILTEIALSHRGQRTNHHMPSVFRSQFRRHGLEFAGIEQIQEQRFNKVVAMVTQCDLGCT